MGPVEILVCANKLGITLAAEAGYVVARPRGATPADLAEGIRDHKPELLALLARPHDKLYYLRECQEDEIDRPACGNGWKPLPEPGSPAYSIVEECREYGVALRIDETGDLVVGKAGAKADEPSQPWPALLVEIETHLEAVARLIEAGWTLKVAFPTQQAPYD